MTRIEAARQTAARNYDAHVKADIENLFRNGPAPDLASFGYRHGWYHVGEFCFSSDECHEEIHGYRPAQQPYMD